MRRETAVLLLLAAAVLVPACLWVPAAPHDPELDGGALGLLVFVLLLLLRPAEIAPGGGWFLGALAAGALPLLLGPAPIPLTGEDHARIFATVPVLGGLVERSSLVAGILLLTAAVAAGRRGLAWEGPVFRSVVLCAVLLSAYGLLQAAGLDPLGWRPDPASPPTAPLAHLHHAAEFLSPALILGLAFGGPWRRKEGWRPSSFLLLLPALHLGYLGVLAARLSLPLGLAWACRRDRRLVPAALLLLACFGLGEGLREATAPAWAGGGAPAAEAAAPGEEAPTEAAAGLLPSSARVRLLLWKATLGRMAEAPLGIGLGRFPLEYPWWRDPEEFRISSHDFRDPAVPRPANPHQEFLLLGVETGWLGLLLFLAGAWKALRRPGRAAWGTAPLLALGVHALVRAPWSDHPAALALTALLLAAGPLPETALLPRDGAGRLRRRALQAVLLALGTAVAAASVPRLGGELALARRLRALEEGRTELEASEAAACWRPWDPLAWSLVAADRSARPEADPARVREALDRGKEADPADLGILTKLFRLEMEAPGGNRARALGLLSLAEVLAPRHPAVRHNRTALIRAEAEARERRGREAFPDPSMRTQFLLQHLLLALAAVREGDSGSCRAELSAAAKYDSPLRARIERLARSPDPDPAAVHALVLEAAPGLAPIAGPPPVP